MRTLRLLAGVTMLGVASVASGQQGPTDTGKNQSGGIDQAWTVSYNNGAFGNARLVANNPGWQNFNGEQDGAKWISVLSTASLGIGATYRFQTTFDLTGYDASTASLTFACWVDNGFSGLTLNGNAIGGIGCNSWTNSAASVQSVTSGFVSGVNTLQFTTTGDGTTDGLLVDFRTFRAEALPQSSVPEPGTWALLGTGLVGLGLVARRRRA